MVCLVYGGYTFGRFAENMVGNVLNLKCYEHATNLLAYFRIRTYGPDLQKGGTLSNYLGYVDPYTSGKFFVSKDSTNMFHLSPEKEKALADLNGIRPLVRVYGKGNNEFKRYSMLEKTVRIALLTFPDMLFKGCVKTIFNSFWKAIATFKFLQETTFNNKLLTTISIVGSFISVFFTPTVRFYYSKKPQEMETDKGGPSGAYCTNKKIERWRVGLTGSLIAGMNSEIFKRIYNDPSKTLKGIAELITCVAVFYFFPHLAGSSIFMGGALVGLLV